MFKLFKDTIPNFVPFLFSSRGVERFSIYVSTNATTWDYVLTDQLTDVGNVDCTSIPLEISEINKSGRYVKIALESWFAMGPALQYVDIEYSQSCSGKYMYLDSFRLTFS